MAAQGGSSAARRGACGARRARAPTTAPPAPAASPARPAAALCGPTTITSRSPLNTHSQQVTLLHRGSTLYNLHYLYEILSHAELQNCSLFSMVFESITPLSDRTGTFF